MPQLSIVIATFNRGRVLIDCLQHTLAAGLPWRSMDIWIVDNASTDDTASLVERFIEETHAPVRLIRLAKNEGPVAKNHGLRRARAPVVLLLDDDAYPLPGTLRTVLRHFQADASLGAAVFDVTLPDGSREGSAYPNVFIGAGTALRRSALDPAHGGVGYLPAEYFMAAEEYDLSFRLIDRGYTVRRFNDLPLVHLKTPGARFATRITRMDVRNNLFLLATYVPAPLCHHLAADWLQRYFLMAGQRDRAAAEGGQGQPHKVAFVRGAAVGLSLWKRRAAGGRQMSPRGVEAVFQCEEILRRLRALVDQRALRRIALGDFGKNIYPFHAAAGALGVTIDTVVDDALAAAGETYRGVPILTIRQAQTRPIDAVVCTTLSPTQAPLRRAVLRRAFAVPVFDLFEQVTPFPLTPAGAVASFTA